MTDSRYWALDQNGERLYVGDTVLRKVRSKPWSDVVYPPDMMFYVITRIEPDWITLQGHKYERKEMPDGGPCSYISVDGPDGPYSRDGSWYANDFVFSCRS